MNFSTIACVVLLIAVGLYEIEAFKWSEKGGVITTLNVVKKPPLFQHTFEVRATEKVIGKAEGSLTDFVFSTLFLPRFVLRFFAKEANMAADLFAARWGIRKIIEYQKGPNATGNAFEPGVDTIVSSVPLYGPLSWSNMLYTPPNGISGEPQVHSICTDSGNSPTVTLCLYISDMTTTANKTTLDPHSIKWSIDISGYSYTQTDSFLALKAGFDSISAIKDFANSSSSAGSVGNDEDALSLNQDDSTISTVAAWIKTVDITGSGCSATASVERSVVWNAQQAGDIDIKFPAESQIGDIDSWSITTRIVYFSFIPSPFCQPSDIFWDPEFGVTSMSVNMLPSISLVMCLMFLLKMLF